LRLTQDLQALPQFSDTDAKAAPDLIKGLKDLTTTKTLHSKRDDFADLYSTVHDTADDLREFFDDNGTTDPLASVSRPTLEMLARYSPEYVWLFKAGRRGAAGKAGFGEGTARPACASRWSRGHRGKFKPHLDEPDFTTTGAGLLNNTRRCRSIPAVRRRTARPTPGQRQAVQLASCWALTRPWRSAPGRRLPRATTPAARGTGSGGADAGKPLNLPANDTPAEGKPSAGLARCGVHAKHR